MSMLLQMLNVVAAVQGWLLIGLVIFGVGFLLLNLIAFRWMGELSGGLASQLSGLLPRFPMYAAVGGLVGILGFTMAYNAHNWLVSVVTLGMIAGLACGMVGVQIYRGHLGKGVFMLAGGLAGGAAGGMIGGLTYSSNLSAAQRFSNAVLLEAIIALAGGAAGATLSWAVKKQWGERSASAVFDLAILMAGGLAGGAAAALAQGVMSWWLVGVAVAISVVLVVWLASVFSEVLAGVAEFGFSGVIMGLGHGPVMGMEYGIGYGVPAGVAIALTAAMGAFLSKV